MKGTGVHGGDELGGVGREIEGEQAAGLRRRGGRVLTLGGGLFLTGLRSGLRPMARMRTFW